MTLVQGLRVQAGLGGRPVVVLPGPRVPPGVLGVVAVLPHVEVEPFLVVEITRRPRPAVGVERDQVRPPVALAEAPRHRPDDFLLLLVVETSVAPQDPDEAPVLVPPADPLAVDRRVRSVEHRLAVLPLIAPVPTPGRQKPHHQPLRVGEVDDIIHMVPVVVARALLHRRADRVEVHQGEMSVGIGLGVPVELGDRHGLDHREPQAGAVVEVAGRVLAGRPVEKLPGRVAQPEERRAILLVDQEPPILADLQPRRLWLLGQEGASQREDDPDCPDFAA